MSMLKQIDPEVAAAILEETKRQAGKLELIPSENFVDEAVLEAQGCIMTNKYAEGYPGKRYYHGCEFVDIVEALAIERAKKLFGADHANVQAHSGTQANMAVYFAVLQPGDEVTLSYDDELLARVPPTPDCRLDAGRYSVWFKPAGLMTQGTAFGDHCALLRLAELQLRPRPVYPVHRLDREAAGLVILAHDSPAAAVFSRLFAERAIAKGYRVEVRGRPENEIGRIDLPLDGQPALTGYRLTAYDPAFDSSALEVETATGRKHQIRRHLALLGVPVIGDPRYGRGNKDPGGLRLTAHRLAFQCPFSGRPMEFAV